MKPQELLVNMTPLHSAFGIPFEQLTVDLLMNVPGTFILAAN